MNIQNEPVIINGILTAIAAVATPLLAKYGIDANGAKELFSFVGAAATAVLSAWGVVRARSKVSPVTPAAPPAK